ncbi:beta-xylosidase [Anseongella ginsenosidimutans]|uniref:Beta-xylosidase n=1 Tax=Anseongella ginsenosidimutans TaxID=496056 RepID=A0A4V2UUB8_9SPHI|nr:family 43 glycosylhydrolase [Anseongella ginsenosidimutans]QEC51239.1 family 43 glycosylhydrolase [Anseongella ginsenosidimutans]TCS90083.1 beta-xylosidase [Anseongella ginsenosidimutans]
MKNTRLLLLAALAACGIYSCSPGGGNKEEKSRSGLAQDEQAQGIVNPVLAGDRPDPTVVKIGDTYWASATSNEWSPLFPIFKSTDLVNWELVTYVFPEGAPDWARNNFWAPELAYDEEQGKVYIYYTARDKETGRLSCAVASADSPEGPYLDHGPLVAQELGSIDAFEARDENGKLYLLWKEDGNSRDQPTPIWAQEINESRTELLGEPKELFRNDKPWEGQLVEGVAIFRKDDYFYATYSAGACCNKECNYKAGVARAKNLLGPWEKYEKNPILKDNESFRCPGHGTVVEKDGDLYYLYHAYSTKSDVYVGRQGVLEKISWTEDGWPVVANDAVFSRETGSLDFTDDFSGASLQPIWQWRVTQDISYETGPEGLKLGASEENQQLGTVLVQLTKTLDYQATATLDLTAAGTGAEGGLALVGADNNGFGAPLAAIGISAGKDGVKVWKTTQGETSLIAGAPLPEDLSNIPLRMEVAEGHLLSFSIEKDGAWESLATGIDAAPFVPWGMGFRLGLVAKGNPSQTLNFKKFELVNE